MKRAGRGESEPVGGDSLLDVSTNIVGILILLVMVVGIRAQQAPGRASPEALKELESLATQAERMEAELRALDEQTAAISRAAEERFRERSTLAYLVAEQQRELGARRDRLAQFEQQAYDLRGAVAEAEAALAKKEEQLRFVAGSNKATVVEIKSYPTPLSQTVFGKEAHCQLRGGRITFIPLDELIDKFKEQARHKVYKLEDLPQISETVGPVGGFRLRYTLERIDVALEDQLEGAGVASFARLSAYTLMPVSNQLGETLEEALAGRSQFRAELAGLGRQTTITLWTYPDSFAEYRVLKEELYERGFSVAGRPLPADHPIGGSPRGSHSAAQ